MCKNVLFVVESCEKLPAPNFNTNQILTQIKFLFFYKKRESIRSLFYVYVLRIHYSAKFLTYPFCVPFFGIFTSVAVALPSFTSCRSSADAFCVEIPISSPTVVAVIGSVPRCFSISAFTTSFTSCFLDSVFLRFSLALSIRAICSVA